MDGSRGAGKDWRRIALARLKEKGGVSLGSNEVMETGST